MRVEASIMINSTIRFASVVTMTSVTKTNPKFGIAWKVKLDLTIDLLSCYVAIISPSGNLFAVGRSIIPGKLKFPAGC